MIALKTLHPSFLPTNTTYSHLHTRNYTLCLCNSNESDSQPPEPKGDVQSQELLAQIAMLQTQKVRLTDYLDERSEYLTQFGEEAKAEFDKVGEDALKGLDEASDRVCIYYICFNFLVVIHHEGKSQFKWKLGLNLTQTQVN